MIRKLLVSLSVAGLVAALTLSSALAATPTPGPKGNRPTPPVAGARRHAYAGKVNSIGTGSFVLEIKGGETVTVLVTDKTRFHIPTVKNASFQDIEVGDRAAVNGTPTDAGLEAKNVAVVPGKPMVQHRVGVVTVYTPGESITIKDTKGTTTTFILTASTVIRGPDKSATVAVDDRVTVVARRVPSTTTYTATAIVVHPK
jgi:hypothetical protein